MRRKTFDRHRFPPGNASHPRDSSPRRGNERPALAGDGVDCKRLAIIGGGVIGVEFAQIYSDLGCAVTILEALPRLLPTMDREISQNLSMILKKRGVSVYTGASVQEIASGDGELLCRFSQRQRSGNRGGLPAGLHGPQAQHGRALCRIV